MNTGVATLVAGEDYSRAVSLATRSKKDYCGFHGYPLVIGTESDVDRDRPIPWSKISIINRTLPAFDYIFWSDADAMFVNYESPLEYFFQDFIDSGKDLILTRDVLGHVNTGNFMLRNSPWSLELLRRIWEQTQFVHHDWWENQAFIELLEKDATIRERTVVVPNSQKPFNSYWHCYDYNYGDLIVHFAGVHDFGTLEKMISTHYVPPKAAPQRELARIA